MAEHLPPEAAAIALPQRCPVCGGDGFAFEPVLWPGLVAEWGLSALEHAYIDLQQGYHCTACGANLRSMALAQAFCRSYVFGGTLAEFVHTTAAHTLRLLEINEAGSLTPFLRLLPKYVFAGYPQIDIRALPFAAGSFDAVVHSDTLEHVEQPLAGLRETKRVLAAGGLSAFTVPIVVGRLSRSRAGLPPSYHGDPQTAAPDFLVRSEFGADVWVPCVEAGFERCELHAFAPPAAFAIVLR